MNFDAIGNIVEIGDWVCCIRNARTSFSVFPAKILEINEKSFKAYFGRTKKYNHQTKNIEECDDIQTLYKLCNVIKIFPETLPEDVYFAWSEKLKQTPKKL